MDTKKEVNEEDYDKAESAEDNTGKTGLFIILNKLLDKNEKDEAKMMRKDVHSNV